MKEKLVIIGASAMGREVCNYAYECGFEVEGFLDSRMAVLDAFDGYPPIIGSCQGYRPSQRRVFVSAVGDPAVRRQYVEMMPSVKWATIIHPSAYVGANVAVGEGSVVCPNVTLTCDICVGKHSIINVNATVSHDCHIGDYVTISPGCSIAGRCDIGEGVFLGVHSVVIPDVRIGSKCFVAAGAVVTGSTAGPRVMGVPARPK